MLMTYQMAKNMGYQGRDLAQIVIAARFHDIGKCLINPQIINQNGTLTEEQTEDIIEHTHQGYEILRSNGLDIDTILWAVFCHHENINGTGYPDQLIGNEIPEEAKIIRVADSFSAMLGDRPYPRGNGKELSQANQQILKAKGTLYEPKVVDAFEKMYEKLKDTMAQIRYLNKYERNAMQQLMKAADEINFHYPIAKVACGIVQSKTGKIEFKAVNSLGVHRHAEVNLILDYLRHVILTEVSNPAKQQRIMGRLTRLEKLSYQFKIDESDEALSLLMEISYQLGKPFKGKTVYSTLRCCDNCVGIFGFLGVREIVFAQEHVDPEFIEESLASGKKWARNGMLIKHARVNPGYDYSPNDLFFKLCRIDDVEKMGDVINQTFADYFIKKLNFDADIQEMRHIVAGFSKFVDEHTNNMDKDTDFSAISEAITQRYKELEKQPITFIKNSNNFKKHEVESQQMLVQMAI
jgi:tRNA(Arg) A34 adenosine deaminase TadA